MPSSDDRPSVERLLPRPAGPTTIEDAYDVDRAPLERRPWIELCMVASLDGSVAVDGSSGALGNPNDVAVLHTLLRLADVLIVGAGTVRHEGYGVPKKPGQRVGVVTNSGRVDLDRDLFTSGAGFLIVPESADVDEDRVEVLRAGVDSVDLTVAVRRLTDVAPGAAHVQAEGGPTLNASLLEHDLIDELALTMSPRIVGGSGPRLTVGAVEVERRYELAHLLVDGDGFVFTRWVRRRPAS